MLCLLNILHTSQYFSPLGAGIKAEEERYRFAECPQPVRCVLCKGGSTAEGPFDGILNAITAHDIAEKLREHF